MNGLSRTVCGSKENPKSQICSRPTSSHQSILLFPRVVCKTSGLQTAVMLACHHRMLSLLSPIDITSPSNGQWSTHLGTGTSNRQMFRLAVLFLLHWWLLLHVSCPFACVNLKYISTDHKDIIKMLLLLLLMKRPTIIMTYFFSNFCKVTK